MSPHDAEWVRQAIDTVLLIGIGIAAVATMLTQSQACATLVVALGSSFLVFEATIFFMTRKW